MDSLMLSPLQLHLRLLPLPNPFVGTRKNPNEFRRIGKSWCFPLAGNGNRFVVSSPLRSWSRLAYSTTATARHKPCSRYAVLGAGFAGISVAWHLLKQGSKEARLCIDIYDDAGIGGGASGASGGLLHPYSPKAKLLWKGAECWSECLDLLVTASRVAEARSSDEVFQYSFTDISEKFVWQRGIVRPASEKNADILRENAQSFLESCYLELLDRNAAQSLVPDLFVPVDVAIYMPLAMNIHPKRYLQALFLACNELAEHEENEIYLFKESINNLEQLSEEYDAVIICLGAQVNKLPELSGKLPLRTCRGVVAQFHLPTDLSEEYHHQRPAILSDAWLAFREPRNVFIGSTWDWNSTNYSSSVSKEEASKAMEELLPKAATAYPPVQSWSFVGAQAGLRAMPPLTPYGSLPLLGCVNGLLGETAKSMYWLIGGLGSRGLLYHGLVGKLTAQAVLSSNEDVLPSEFTSWKNGIKMNY
ncbi:uncharacterized protein LOC122055882 [Zingiber officinale]|uniref:uncharacterized protein LOC122055882 n=1 Tax=Zingiber officinale TaxID=94328 RepID=UPI001C4A8BD7|nr:uncharacterized protein LOC122055882 [Zingiber officinale]